MTGSVTNICYWRALALCKGGRTICVFKVTKLLGTLGTLELILIIKDLAGTLRRTYGTLQGIPMTAWAIASLTNQFPIDKSEKLDYALSQSITKKTECQSDTLSTQ